MSGYAICNYVKFREPSGSSYIDTAYYFQNFTINGTRTRNSETYSFAPFALATGGGEKGGDRSANTLVIGASTEVGSTLILNLFKQAVEERWLLVVETVSLNPNSFVDDQLISTETWRVGSYEMDTKTIRLQLLSALDAVKGQVPNRRLTEDLVGSLATTGNLSVS
tara:strand:+ start:337 stop:834 length:498 start_codon:yes stop_codon:yes gene_type:complete